ncbi:SUMO-specific isopeptidase USPL1 [Liparis tanakae]|uniref:SUMO-specific isopeptidase USPL1 n=1 Tax=Liparis tanakae TaxID=230148 RepID=A0A4Z2GPP3_9TELE|nr:SUMO-specific isopeptidase USPL1 [Liparis tanakae]
MLELVVVYSSGGEPGCSDMVIFVEWYWNPVDQRSDGGLPMTDEDTGLGALASPLVQERAASLECCPWCTAKGLTSALRCYRINLQESVTLCTNPQCLFPLVSRSLEDVLASLDPVEPAVGNKRKKPSALEKDESVRPRHKRLRASDSLGPQSIPDAPVSPAEDGAANIVNNGHHAAPKTEEGKLNGYRDSPPAETAGWESLQYQDDALVQEPEIAACADGLTAAGHLQGSSEAVLTADEEALARPHLGAPGASEDDFRQVMSSCCGLDSNRSFPATEGVYPIEINPPSPQTARTEPKSPTADVGSAESETDGLSSAALTKSEELVSVHGPPFWRNSDNLCWLDSLLVALVNCRSLRKCRAKDEPQQSSVWQLMRGYEDVCASIQVHQRTGRDGAVGVPTHVLQTADADLLRLRMSVFKLLAPKLHCKLGQRETPVFAMPLLLESDSWAEPLFQSSFRWEFKCSGCKTTTRERVMKTLPTFTKVLLDWSPLHAVHLAPCNVCGRKKQRRTMMLESVPPVFALHFVEGLPDNDVAAYAFAFQEKRYSVTTVLQYDLHLKHFVTWTRNADGSWLEYDDLQHPECRTHPTLPVPPREMHVLFWEQEEDKEPRLCSPSSTFAESPPSQSATIPGRGLSDLTADAPSSCSPDQSFLGSRDVADIVRSLSAPEDDDGGDDDATDAAVDTSIGSTTLLDTFEGLSQDDIITLTLVELKLDAETQPSNDEGEAAREAGVPSAVEALDSSPDSSSAAVIGSEGKNPLNPLPKTTPKSDPAPKRAAVAPPKPPAPLPQSTPNPARRPQNPGGFFPKPPLKMDDGAGLPLKAAEMYGGFGAAASIPRSAPPCPPAVLNGKSAPLQPPPSKQQTTTPEVSRPKKQSSPTTKLPPGLSDTDALRYKLIKKLKAKKKKLAKLNEMLGHEGAAGRRRPDSTARGSPHTVTSSTYDGAACDDFLSDLLSPATTASNLSPDSTGFLEMITSGQERAEPADRGGDAAAGRTHAADAPDAENFLEEFLSQAVAQGPSDMETEALSALELFV